MIFAAAKLFPRSQEDREGQGPSLLQRNGGTTFGKHAGSHVGPALSVLVGDSLSYPAGQGVLLWHCRLKSIILHPLLLLLLKPLNNIG